MNDSASQQPSDESTGDSSGAAPNSYKMFRSEDLFQGDRVVHIEHAGAIYRLQITSRGKLILQK